QILFSIDKPLFGLITGSSIYCSAFLFGPQMDYKWTFLLLCLPGVLTLAHQIPPWSHLARCWLICAFLYAYWLFFSSETSLRNALFRQAFSWSLFGLNSILIGRFWLSNGLL
ncbi:MAG: hypothetical protein NZL93_04090, partial [Chthoniobacterales bacterium]|nr:hypothetical protein [Chthoniobacterales bacterium]